MEPNSPKKIQFAVPLFQSQIAPEAAEQVSRSAYYSYIEKYRENPDINAWYYLKLFLSLSLPISGDFKGM